MVVLRQDSSVLQPTHKEASVQIRTDKWHYKLWELTFDFGDACRPDETTPRQYILRILSMLIPFAVDALILIVSWFAVAIIGNLISIVSGAGYYHEILRGPCFRRFHPWVFTSSVRAGFVNFDAGMRVTTKTIAMILWLALAFYATWYVAMNTRLFQQLGDVTINTAIAALVGTWPVWWLFGKIILLCVVAFFAAFVMMKFSDKLEFLNQERVQQMVDKAEETNTPFPAEIVTFIDPAVDDASIGV